MPEVLYLISMSYSLLFSHIHLRLSVSVKLGSPMILPVLNLLFLVTLFSSTIELDMVAGLQSMLFPLFISFSLRLLPHTPSSSYISVSITFQKLTFHVACFYRPPSSLSDLVSLTNLLLSLGPTYSSGLILVRDFNVNNISTQLHTQPSSLSTLLSLKQHVTDPTCYSHSGAPSILDLVFTPPSLATSISISCPIGTSDHNSIFATILLPSLNKKIFTFYQNCLAVP